MGENYKVADLVITEDNQIRVFDVDGSLGGGLRVLRDAYGKTKAREIITPLIQRFGEIANGKPIFYIHIKNKPMTFQDIPPIIPYSFRNCYPQTSWFKVQEERNKRDLKSFEYQEPELLTKIARQNGIRLIFCSGISKTDEGYFVMNMRDKFREIGESKVIPASEIGMLFRREHIDRLNIGTAYKGFDFPVINSPEFDYFLDEKIFFRTMLQNSEFYDLLPNYIFVGMGLSTKQQIRDFLQTIEEHPKEPHLVLKPVIGSSGLDIRYPTKEDIHRLFELDKPDPDYNYKRLIRVATTNTVDLIWRDEFEAPKGKWVKMIGEPKDAKERRAEMRHTIEAEGALDKVFGIANFEDIYVIPWMTSILEEFVHAKPTIVDGIPHKGYIRAVMFGDKLVGAVNRLTKEPYNGNFRDLTDYDVKTFWHRVDSNTQHRIEETLIPMFNLFESRLEKILNDFNADDVKTAMTIDLLQRAESSMAQSF